MSWTDDILAVIYPDICAVCGTTLVAGERVICLGCLAAMPRTAIHLSDFNSIHARLAGPAKVDRTAAYFHYERSSPYAALIHKAKYRGMPRVAATLAGYFTRELLPSGFFDGIDIIEPVPLHILRLITRGYNQSEIIAGAISEITGIAVGRHLAARYHRSQTRLDAEERAKAARSTFHFAGNPADLDGRHILVVDDVVTTGATLAACCEAIRSAAPSARISVLTLAATRLA